MEARAESRNENESSLTGLVRTLVSVIEEKDNFIKGHSERVATDCVRFCTKLGFPKKEIERLYLAGLLHDIGVVYIPKRIIHKSGKLTEDEIMVVQQHPLISEKILSKHSVFNDILGIIRHHHEAMDGTGYPDGLKGDEIPMAARILRLVNSFHAMVSARPQWTSLSVEETLKEIKKKAGREFDRNLVTPFVEFIRSDAGASPNAGAEKGKASGRDVIISIIKKFKEGKIDLPLLPGVVLEIQRVISRPGSTIDDMTRVIEKDAAISLKLIAVANSPLYRATDRIISVKQAIPRLGIEETQNLVTAIAGKGLFKAKNPAHKALMEEIWLHSLASAYCTQFLARKLTLGEVDIYFLMGLLHDIGKAPLLNIMTEMLPGEEPRDMPGFVTSIQEVHTSFGGALLRRWGFSQDFSRIATRHEGPSYTSDTEKAILAVNLSNALTHQIGYGASGGGDTEPSELDSARLLHVDAVTLKAIGEDTKAAMEDSAHLF